MAGGETRNHPPEKSVESVSGEGEHRSVRSVAGVKNNRNLEKKRRRNLKNISGIWKIMPGSAFFFAEIWNFSLKIAGIGRIWLNPTKSSRTGWDLARSGRNLGGSGLILQVWPDFLYNSGRVWVAPVLEKQTCHSTRRCRFLRTETRRRPIEPSARPESGRRRAVWPGYRTPVGSGQPELGQFIPGIWNNICGAYCLRTGPFLLLLLVKVKSSYSGKIK